KNLGQMLLTTHLQEQHLFLFFVYLFFVNQLCLLHVRYNLCFHRFANHNFHAFALCQYLHSFYFLALFDYDIVCFFVHLISLFVFFLFFFFFVFQIFLFLLSLSVTIFIRSTFSLSLIMKLHAL